MHVRIDWIDRVRLQAVIGRCSSPKKWPGTTRSRAADNTAWSSHAATSPASHAASKNDAPSGWPSRWHRCSQRRRRPTRTAEALGHDATRPGAESRRDVAWHRQQRGSLLAHDGVWRSPPAWPVAAPPASLTTEAANGGARRSLSVRPHPTSRLPTGPPQRRPPACTRIGCPCDSS